MDSVRKVLLELTRTARERFPQQQSHLLVHQQFNPIQAWGGTLCPPHLYHSISSKRLGVWSHCFVNFLSMYIPFRKVQFHQSALMYGIPLEAHHKAQSSDIFLSFQAKKLRAVIFYLLANHAETAYLSIQDEELSKKAWLVQVRPTKVAAHTFWGLAQVRLMRPP